MLVPFCCVWYHHYSVSGKSSGEWSISKKLVSIFQVQCSLLHLLSSLQLINLLILIIFSVFSILPHSYFVISIMLYITSMFMKTTHFQQANLMKKFPGLPCQRYMMVD